MQDDAWFEPDLQRAASFHLLGLTSWDDVQTLQRRLMRTVQNDLVPHAHILFAEHPEIICVGRSGSRSHIRLTYAELEQRRLGVRWVDRGGGSVLHAPGQLAVYVILSLQTFGMLLSDYQRLLREAVAKTLRDVGLTTLVRADSAGLWGRTGMLAALAVGARRQVVSDGAFLNVAPDLSLFRQIDTAAPFCVPGERTTMSSILAERRWPTRMSTVRARLIEQLATVLACDRYNIHSGHPWLPGNAATRHELATRRD